MARIRKVFTFSNVVACVALFVALGGSVYAAGKISGKQIKANSLPGNRIKPKTIASNRIKPKSLTGNQIKAHSLKGAQIDQSTLNEIAAASLAGVQYAVATVSLPKWSPGTSGTANCPAGTNVVGGGAVVSNDERAAVNDSGPTDSRTGWTATGFGWSIGADATPTMTVTAICVAVKMPVGPGPATNPVYTDPRYHPAG
jgi:hypothetical protein